MNREDYCDVQELFRGDQRFRSLRIAIDAAIRLTEIFHQMHREGRHLRSFRSTDLAVHPESGQVMAIDGDFVHGDPKKENCERWNLPYTPPEVIVGRRDLDQFSDWYVLAVLIFQFLTGGVHPLAGKRSVCPVMTEEMKLRQYGMEPLFMFDPNDRSNGPDPKLHREAEAIWVVLPEWIKESFLHAFGRKGMDAPGTRPTEEDWRESLIRFQNRMILCDCGNVLIDSGENTVTCDRCGQEIHINFRIETKEELLPAVRGNRVYRSRGETGEGWNPNPAARVVGAQNDSNRLGVQNISGQTWQALTTKGKARNVKNDEVIPLKDGIICQYGDSLIKITDMRCVGEK